MPDNRTPLEIIDSFAKAVEAHPNAPLTESEREAIRRGAEFFQRVDTLIWFFGWGKWVIAIVIAIATQWGRIQGAWDGWSGH